MLARVRHCHRPVGTEMKVARQFTAWEVQKTTVPSRRDRVSWFVRRKFCVREKRGKNHGVRPSLTGRVRLYNVFQAVNCLATLIQSLRDENDPRAQLTLSPD